MKDRIRALIASLILTVQLTSFLGVYAAGSILGTEEVFRGTVEIGDETFYTKNVFYSDQSGVGNQSEYYIEYSPNTAVSPMISNGSAVYGRHNIYESYDYLKSNGYTPIAAINADFYSLQTGVPMSHCISDGHILTKDSQPQDAIAFLDDGSAFIGYLGIYMTANKDGQSIAVENINKYRQPYSVYLFTDEFGSETYDTAPGLVVVLTDVGDGITLEGNIEATVESVDYYSGSIKIPKGKYVISINDNLKEQDNYKFFESLVPGDKLTLTTSFEGDRRFADAKYIMGGSQGRLLNGGTVNTALENGAAPRTAIGVKQDGSTVFYTIDGRQTGRSYGVRIETLGKRLKELGCTDALLLDGGGSTTCAVVLPGYSEFKVVNSPSDGSVRKNANYFFLVNNQKPVGDLDKLYLYPMDMNLLSGASSKVTAAAADKNFYSVSLSGAEYSVSGGTIDSNGNFTAVGDGTVDITAAKNGVTASVEYNVYKSPTSITASVSGKTVTSISAEPGETVQITANAKYGNKALVSQNSCYTWAVSDERVGKIDGGVFTAGNVAGANGEILITAGDTTTKIPVTIKGNTDSPEYFHKIDNFNFDGEKIMIDIKNDLKVNINKNDIEMKIDREKVSVDFDNGVLTYMCPAEFGNETHRVSVKAVNEFGNTSIAFFEIKGNDNVENPFSDIDTNWAKNIILFMNKQGVINGYTENSGEVVFRPQDSMTRAQFAVMISNYLNIDVDKYINADVPFTDVESLPQWALPQIKAMYSLNIISGRSSDDGVYFDPNTKLTRAEAMTILARVLPNGVLKDDLEFSDNADIPSWAYDGMAVMTDIGAVSGYEDNTIKPLNNITRAECAKLLYSIF